MAPAIEGHFIVPSEEMTVIIAVLLRNDDCLNKFKSSLVHSTSKRLLDFYKKKKLLHEASQYNSDDCVRVRS
jgi:hypothetical protein